MATISIDSSLREQLLGFLKKNKKADLLTAYLFFLEKKLAIQPVIFLREKTVFRSKEEVLRKLEEQSKLWRETEVKIQVGQPSVNELTQKIYICPFTGKVFGNNTHPNPQDAIYEWVSKCPENTERHGGLKVKRFYISEDPELIKNYIQKTREPITKTVYSSVTTGKLFNTKQSVIEDFIEHQLKPIALVEVPSQNRYQIEETFMDFIQKQLDEQKISAFVESLSDYKEFEEYLANWLDEKGDE